MKSEIKREREAAIYASISFGAFEEEISDYNDQRDFELDYARFSFEEQRLWEGGNSIFKILHTCYAP